MHVKAIAGLATAALALILPATALADFGHITQPGETLTSIAAVDGLSVDALAAANGLSRTAELTVGEIVQIPARSTAIAGSTAHSITVRAASAASSATSAGTGTSTGVVAGRYVVQPGDTLSAIAARAGISTGRLARLNGINPNAVLFAGRSLDVPGAVNAATTTESATTTQTPGPATGSGNQQITGDTSSGPYPTHQFVTGGQVGNEAAAAGVDPALAEAIGWQESGYDNDLVSSTGAVGVMQIEPATWAWINQVLRGGDALNPSSASDNVAGGVDLLRNLVAQTGSESAATAAYYQGLASLREHGMYASTEQYVADVEALQARFGH